MADDFRSSGIPANSVLLGYGPMLPLVAAGLAAWLLPQPWPFWAVQSGLLWGAMILIFIAGVRRGYGFGRREASTGAGIGASLLYFALAGIALVVARSSVALLVLTLGYALAALLDRRAALAGNAPAFATLRPRQLLIGAGGLALLFAWTVSR